MWSVGIGFSFSLGFGSGAQTQGLCVSSVSSDHGATLSTLLDWLRILHTREVYPLKADGGRCPHLGFLSFSVNWFLP